MGTSKEVEINGGILVGHDGSMFADQAVSWALKLARALGIPVTIVRAWSLTTASRPESWSPGYMPPLEDFEAAVVEALRRDTELALADYQDVQVSCQAVHGKPARRLIEASRKADMIVVGRRGLGGFKGLLLGSVSEQIVGNAHCTVVVVKSSNDDQSPAQVEPDQGLEPAPTD